MKPEPTERDQVRRWLAEKEAPVFEKGAFVCPRCGAYAHQQWGRALMDRGTGVTPTGGAFSQCAHCEKYSYWADQKLAHPTRKRGGPPPHQEMPEAVRADYLEAQEVLEISPRGACALLRLGLQKQCIDLGEPGKNLNDDIGALVQRGLAAQVQQALDALRVIGNNAVHPGEFDVTDDLEIAAALFECLNLIVEQLVAQPNRIGQLYEHLPEGARKAIDRRDSP